MTRNYGRIKTTIWGDEDFRQLSDGAQALYLRLLSSPTLNLCGVCQWRPNLLAKLTKGMTPARVRVCGQELVEANYVVIDEDWEEVLVRTFVKHESVVHNPKTAAGAATAFKAVMSTSLRFVISREMARLQVSEPELKGWPYVQECLSFAETMGDRLGIESGIYRLPDRVPIHQNREPKPKTENPRPSQGDEGDEKFEEFWSAYPKRKGDNPKKPARAKWDKLIKDVDPERIISAAKAYAATRRHQDPQYTPQTVTWLNQERWRDADDAADFIDDDIDNWMNR